MFDIGFWEIGLICLVVLIVVGPERLPGMMRKAGLWIGKARRMVGEVRAEVEREFQVEELRQSLSKQSGSDEIKQLANRIKAINQDIGANTSKQPDFSNSPDAKSASKSQSE